MSVSHLHVLTVLHDFVLPFSFHLIIAASHIQKWKKITLLNYFIKEIALIRWMALVVAAKQDSVVHGASITLMIVSRYLVEMVTHKLLLFF